MQKESLEGFIGQELSVAVPHRAYGKDRPFYWRGKLKEITDDTITLVTEKNETILVKLDWILQVVK